MKFKLLLLLSCVGASAYSMQAPLGVDEADASTTHREEETDAVAVNESQRGQKRHLEVDEESALSATGSGVNCPIVPLNCRVVSIKASLVDNKKYRKFKSAEPVSKPVRQCITFTCPDCRYATTGLLAFKKHKDLCAVPVSSLPAPQINQVPVLELPLVVTPVELDRLSISSLRLARVIESSELATPLTPPSPERVDAVSEEELPIVTKRSQRVIDDSEYVAQAAQIDKDSYAEYLLTVAHNKNDEEVDNTKKPAQQSPTSEKLRQIILSGAESDSEFTKECIERWKKQDEARKRAADAKLPAVAKFICEDCGKAYARKCNLGLHKNTAHKEPVLRQCKKLGCDYKIRTVRSHLPIHNCKGKAEKSPENTEV